MKQVIEKLGISRDVYQKGWTNPCEEIINQPIELVDYSYPHTPPEQLLDLIFKRFVVLNDEQKQVLRPVLLKWLRENERNLDKIMVEESKEVRDFIYEMF